MTKEELNSRIKELLKEEVPSVDFSQSDRMAENGYIDSLSLTRIIQALSLEFDVTIPYEDIVPENFNSVQSMVELVSGLLEG